MSKRETASEWLLRVFPLAKRLNTESKRDSVAANNRPESDSGD